MQKRDYRRIPALFLAIIMVFSLLPLSAFAVGGNITVYLTVSDRGTLAKDKNGQIVAQIPVTLSGEEGYTIDDAFAALHNALYPGGADAGYVTSTGSYGLSVDQFWGNTTGTSFYVNNISSNGVSDAISNGDYITAYNLLDTDNWTDKYAYFSADTVCMQAGESQTLTLKSDSWGTPGVIAGAQLTLVSDDGATADIPDVVTDENGQAAISFEEAGTYIVSAGYDEGYTAPVCRVTVTDPEQPHISVRIEGNGLGTDGAESAVGTVLPNTIVNLSDASSTMTALEAVNEALTSNGLPPAVGSGGFYTALGGVSGTGYASWMFMLDDAYSADGLDEAEVGNGDSIVLALANYSMVTDTYTTGYSYFKVITSSGSVQWGYPCGEVTLALYDMTNTGWNPDYSPLWEVVPVPDAEVYAGDYQAYTPDGALAVTDGENGVATISLWGGTDAGTYYFDISSAVDGSTDPYCRVKMVYDGTNPPALFFSQPTAEDTTLSALSLTFPGTSAISGLPYLGTAGMTLSSAVESVSVVLAANDPEALVSVTYQAAGAVSASVYAPGDSAELAVGENVFKFAVTNGMDRQIYTLKFTRQAESSRDIPAEVAAVIGGVRDVTGDAPYSDWVLAMHAAGLQVSDARLTNYLAAVLSSVDSFADSGVGSVGTVAKHAIALTALGIDAREIPDPDGGAAIDLFDRIASYTGTVDPVYSAPYILSLYDLGNYEVPDTAANTRQTLIAAILGSQDGVSGLWASADGTGMVLPSLAPYYGTEGEVNGVDAATCSAVTSAVDAAVSALSAMQAVDGGLGSRNSNTTSTVIVGLNALGINPHTDVRFVKSGSSLLTDLLSFRTSDDKLGYSGSASANTMACYQGFQALATYQNLEGGSRNRNLYHFTAEIAPYTAWPDARLLTAVAVTTTPDITTYSLDGSDTAHVPDTSGIVITATYNANPSDTEVIPASACTFSAVDCSTSGTKTVTVTYQDKTATYTVTVLNSDSSEPEKQTVSVTVRSSGGTIASGTVVIEQNVTSALDVLKTALNRAGKPYVIRNGTYVASVDGIGEFDEGSNSGWLYSVNGYTPSTTSASDYTLADGDTILWYYTLDYTGDVSSSAWSGAAAQTAVVSPAATVSGGAASAIVTSDQVSKAISAARKGGTTAVTISPEITQDVSGMSVSVPGTAVQSLAGESGMSLVLDTPLGGLELGSGTLASIGRQAGAGSVVFNLERKTAADVDLEEEDLEHSVIVAVSITSGGNSITAFGGGTLKLSLPVGDGYTEGESYKVVVISAVGGIETLWGKSVVKDGETYVEVTAAHLSTFVVTGKMAGSFADVAKDAWYYGAVKYAEEGGLFQGTSEGLFLPDANMSRAMLATVLYRLAGSPDVTDRNGFSDVEAGAWYADAVCWAGANGIIRGIGNGLYGPDIPISRQETAVMLCRFAAYRDEDLSGTADLSVYADADHIADWARDAMTWANAGGLISGAPGGLLMPDKGASRAAVAAILMRYAKKTEN